MYSDCIDVFCSVPQKHAQAVRFHVPDVIDGDQTQAKAVAVLQVQHV